MIRVAFEPNLNGTVVTVDVCLAFMVPLVPQIFEENGLSRN